MNFLKNIGKWFLPLLVIAVLLAASYGVQRRLHALRVEYKLVDTNVVENAPPVVVFTTVALGSFRGLVADMLWLYSQKMQDQGNYFEMVQLASWMVKLQPRFTGATAFLAWNMAYNVSVTFSGFEDRWRWVQRGIELIRDEALLYNPNDPELYKELGWIYQHKLGQEMDDANRYYKLQLAKQMLTCFGSWPVDWKAWSDSPRTPEALQATLGEAKWQEFERILTEAGTDSGRCEKAFRAASGKLPEDVATKLAAAGLRPAIELYLRVRWLQERWKLDASLIYQIEQKYGELDWRLPEAHAIYWSTKGLNQTDKLVNLTCERMIFQSLSNVFRGGRLAYMSDLGALEVTPNTSVVDALDRQYQDSMLKHADNQSIRSGYRNWLIDAIVVLYSFGKDDKAAEYYRKLQQAAPGERKYRRPLEEFALDELAGDVASLNFDQAHSSVQGFLYQFLVSLAVGDTDRAETFELIAHRIWERYMKQIGEGASKERRKLPEFKSMKTTMFERCLQVFPPDMKAMLEQTAAQAGINLQDLRKEKPLTP